MGNYLISGVWKDGNDKITHYAVHEKNSTGWLRANKTTKSEAIKLVEKSTNNVMTVVWQYDNVGWYKGEEVHLVNGKNGKYLRSNPDNTLTDNLGHLIRCSWFF